MRFILICTIWCIGLLSQNLNAQHSHVLADADKAYGLGVYRDAIRQYQLIAAQNITSNKEVYIQALASQALATMEVSKDDYLIFELLQKAEEAQQVLSNVSAETKLRLSTALAKYHLLFREYDLLKPLITDALTLREKATSNLSPTIDIEINSIVGDWHFDRDKNEEALPYYEALIKASEGQANDAINYEQLVEVKMKVGKIHDKLLAPDEAIDRYRNILKKKKELLQKEPEKEGELCYRIGELYYERKEYEMAAFYLEQSLLFEMSSTDLAATRFMLAVIYQSDETYNKALVMDGKALAYWYPLSKQYIQPTFQALLILGELCMQQKKVGLAKRTFGAAFNKTTNWTTKALIQEVGESWIYYLPEPSLSENHNIALLAYLEAEQQITKMPKEQQVIAAIDVEMAKGGLFFGAKNYKRAKEHYLNALELMKTVYTEKHPLVAEASRALSEVFLEESIFDQALDFIEKALNASLDEGQNIGPQELPDISQAKFPFELLNALGTKAKILQEQYFEQKDQKLLLQSLQLLKLTTKLLNRLRKTYREDGAKYKLSAMAQKFNHQGGTVCHWLYTLTNDEQYIKMAFDYSEGSKSSVLLSVIQDLQAKKVSGIPDTILNKEKELKVDISYLKSEIYYQMKQGIYKDVERLVVLEEELREKESAHKAIITILEQNYQKYFNLKYNYTTLSILEVQKGLKENELMLEYLTLDSLMLVFGISNNDFFYKGIPIERRLFQQEINRTINGVVSDNIVKFLNNGQAVYRRIIQPILDKISQENIIIISDNLLNQIPFELLPTTDKKTSKYGQIDYWLRDKAICYNYSATLYLKGKVLNGDKQSKEKIMALAPNFALLDSIFQHNSGYSKAIQEFHVSPLPYATKEVNVIGELFDAPLIGGGQATETNFKTNAQNYGVLHFATHGVLNQKKPLFSNLLFLVDEENDGLLYTHELYNMELNAELVTLSACNSGVGKHYQGEGIMSIARGFAYSGTPNLVMSLWEVSDGATQVIMEIFYKYLKQGLGKHQALRQAKLDFLNGYSEEFLSPRLWGGFVIMGNTDPVLCLISETQQNSLIGWIIAGLLLIGIAIWFKVNR